MQIAITAVAHSGARVVKVPAMIGSMAALESWNSTMAKAKIKSAQLRATLAKALDDDPHSRLSTPPRASSGSMSADRICAKAMSVGTASAAVRKEPASATPLSGYSATA
jgi:hypothetical protein